MKVISFLGTTEYKVTTYTWNGEKYLARYFPVAVGNFFKPEVILICATPTVEKHDNLKELCTMLDATRISWKIVPIPEGHSEPDLWKIFDALTEAVGQGETVTFDVTHSFRSLPFLAFLAIAYLRSARNVKVEHVLYGAYEARDPETNLTPVFDLTPFVCLLDWTTATERFVETGEGRSLAELLKAGMPSGLEMGKDLETRRLGNNLKWAADAIQAVSLALQVTRPYEVMESADQLSHTLEQAMPAIRQKARPFAVLAENIKDEYGQFGLKKAKEETNLAEGLWRQLKMIKWYIEREQVVQAATMMREWIVSLVALNYNIPLFVEHDREEIAVAINNEINLRSGNRIRKKSVYDEILKTLKEIENVIKIWDKMNKLRNDIAHVGMRSKPKTALLLKKKVGDLFPQLEELAEAILLPLTPG